MTDRFIPEPGCPSIVELAIELWGQPTSRKPDELRFGTNGSKSVRPSDNTWFDHERGEGGGYVEIHRVKRGDLPKRRHANGNGRLPPWEDIATTYGYHDPAGHLVLEVVRTLSGIPRFRQRRPIGNGKWKFEVKNLPGHDCLLYRLPGLRASGDATTFITEGEKDADRLHGECLIATTNIGGAGKWRKEYNEEFRGKPVVVLVDNDEAGRAHAATIARSLHGIAGSVRVLALPRLPEKGDVSDWLNAGNTVEELERLARATPDYKPSSEDDGYAGLAEQLAAGAWLVREVPPMESLLGEFITAATRCFIVGRTGLGKTLLGLAMAIGMASGEGFLHWRSSRPARVVYIDGEMPIDLLIERVRDAARRIGHEDLLGNLMLFSAEDAEELAEQYPTLGMLEPLNTDPGQDFIKRLCAVLKPDTIIFDNVQALLVGVQKEEETWLPVLPLVQWLTKQRIAQVWIDHTGHNTDRQYGSSLKSWRFDVVGHMADLTADQTREPQDTAFVLSFTKARRRKPANWDDFAPHIIRLRQDQWFSEPLEQPAGGGKPHGKVPPSRMVFHDALIDAIVHASTGPGETTNAAWEAECLRRKLIEPDEPDDDKRDRDRKKAKLRTARSDLQAAHLIGVDGERVMDLTRSYR
jgi:hypothetical protein